MIFVLLICQLYLYFSSSKLSSVSHPVGYLNFRVTLSQALRPNRRPLTSVTPPTNFSASAHLSTSRYLRRLADSRLNFAASKTESTAGLGTTNPAVCSCWVACPQWSAGGSTLKLWCEIIIYVITQGTYNINIIFKCYHSPPL